MNNLIDINLLTKSQIEKIFSYSNSNIKKDCLKNKTIGLMFDNPSTRTRLSFVKAINDLKGNVLEIDPNKLNLSRYESMEDTAKMFSLYLDAFIYRCNSHSKFQIFSKNFDKSIVNAMTDMTHPCQALSDYYTLVNRFKKKVIKIIWLGDITNVLMSLIQLAEIFNNLELHVVSTKKIVLNKKIKKHKFLKIYYSIPYEIMKKFDCIMTDTFTSMNDKYLKNKTLSLKKFQINQRLMDLTNDKCVFMHCLPAKIGFEVTKEIIYGSRSIIIEQAKNRMVVQKGILKWLNI